MSSVEPYINIIIALLGLAYPILLQVITKLDERYESENIADLFKTEWELKAFRYSLVASLISAVIWSLKLEPLVDIKVLENTDTLLVAFNTIILVISFFFFVNKVLKYYTLYSIVPYLIGCHEKSKNGVKFFIALSDLLLLSINKQQTNVSRTLSDFFYTAFKNIREKIANEPVVYPDLYYETVYKAIEELAILKEKRNYLLEHDTSGGVWLLGAMQGKEISEKTYAWLWRNLLLAVRYQQDDLVVYHWETCYQYYSYSLPNIYPKYGNLANNFQVSNQESVNKRNAERQRFIEFHYVLGGLLTYKERYACIKRLFSYTQSYPPKYELLPESMYEIFKFYFDLKDPYERKYAWISHQYPFPELSGLNADYLVKKWVMSYMAILFLRQYTIIPYLSIMRPLDFPPIPKTQGEIKQWIDGIDYFKKLVSEHLQNVAFLETLNLNFIKPEWCNDNQKPYPITFIETFKESLEKAYHTNALTLRISNEKVAQFDNATKIIIESAINKLQRISNETIVQDDSSDKWYVNGQTMLQSKDAFSENPEVHYMDFDSFLASVISTRLNDRLSETFLYKRTKSFLLKSEDLFRAIDNLAIDDNYIIVNFGLNLDYFINDLKIPELSNDKYKKKSIYSFDSSRMVRDSLFIIKKSDLPNISTKSIVEDIVEKYSLRKISDIIDLYTSVIDLNNTSEEVLIENKQGKSDDEVRKSVLLCNIISTEFKWKKNIEVIQLIQHSEFLQQGIVNKLDDVKPIKKRKTIR